ncbi:TOBE domain-containing protein [Natrarchaeobius halalkaliphilus]|uniref:TOBE domain-containing protein n=1 Tax=Natrarchaeobius halalkaliphilus TaxID=1679091 RepID=UPI001FB53A2A|nr:TOBE domain-containing protein [Natrarchaeobius halalkaliphilus]
MVPPAGRQKRTDSTFVSRGHDSGTDAGPIVALVPEGAREVRITVRSDSVILTAPSQPSEPPETSLRNRFSGTIERLESGDAITRVTIRLDDDCTVQALVTKTSADRLELEDGKRILAAFKATAARAIALDADARE